ncbi:16S rRNA m(7)G-527 methyltransferase [Lachnospiraceae bacterium XBB1006]|nr:16S rRNA m(7)G-527 methyltransferase [Lachnospiraceae bacterium XBB1006]
MFQSDLLFERCKEIGLILSDKQLENFSIYYDMLIEKNKVMNLTAITDMEEVIHKHFVDSLLLHKVVCVKDISSIADMGTGAGFPGIPLKIAFPHLNLTLMDSLNKRLMFLNDVIDALKLEDIKTVHGRAEDIGRMIDYREQFDVCVSRAVANLSTLSEYCLPLVKIGGSFISYKSGSIEEELLASCSAIELLGGMEPVVSYLTLPGTTIERSFIKIDKEKMTPKKYPRKAGVPSKEPL